MNKIKVKLNPENPEPTEIIAESIIKISAAMEKIRAGRLNDRALVCLIHDSLTGVGKTEIALVLNALKDLKDRYIRKSAKKEKP